MNNKNVTIVDYGCGNILSLKKALEACGATVTLTRDPHQIINSERLILPGVGAFGHCVDKINEYDLLPVLKQFIDQGRPILGICVGMQMLLNESFEYGRHAGLGYVPGVVDKIQIEASQPDKKVPFIGWADVKINASHDGHQLFDSTENNWFYFVHSYCAKPTQSAHVLGVYHYYDEAVTALITKDNVIGCQFHPEKSGQRGLLFLQKFLRI